jgi:hypothetical protein
MIASASLARAGVHSLNRWRAFTDATPKPAASSRAFTSFAGVPSANSRPSTSLRTSTALTPEDTASVMKSASDICGAQVRFRAKRIGIEGSLKVCLC